MNKVDKNLAIVLGETIRFSGKLSRSHFNKIIGEHRLGYDKLSKEEFSDFVLTVQGDDGLYKVFSDASNGIYTVSDVEPADSRLKGLDDKDVFPVVSPAITDKVEMANMLSAYRKFQKAGAAQKNIATQVTRNIEHMLGDIEVTYHANAASMMGEDTDMIVQLSDWHIGALIDVNGNSYDYATAKKRLRVYLDEVAHQVELHRPKHIIIAHAGDFIEHVSMRANDQAFNAEFLSSEQITLAIKLMVETITEIAMYTERVTVAMVGGNHDRMQGSKSEGINGDSAAYVILQQLLLLNDYSVMGDNIDIVDNSVDIYNAEIKTTDGRVIVLTHGDSVPKGKPAAKALMAGSNIDMVLLGHYHYFSAMQEQMGSQTIMGGSLQGFNSYSKRLHTPDSMASQNVIVLPQNVGPTVTITPVMLP